MGLALIVGALWFFGRRRRRSKEAGRVSESRVDEAELPADPGLKQGPGEKAPGAERVELQAHEHPVEFERAIWNCG